MLAHRCWGPLTLAAALLARESPSHNRAAQAPIPPASSRLERRGWEAVKRKDTRGLYELAGGSFI